MGINHRMTDCKKWSDKWFRNLDPEEQLFWFYIHDRCDQAGVWNEDIEEVKFHIGTDYDPGTLLKSFGEKIKLLPDSSKWWIKDYCILQQTTYIWDDEEGPPRRAIYNLMVQHNIYEEYKTHYVESFPGVDLFKQREESKAKRKGKASPKVKDKIKANEK
jgi:hypothetical protein